MLDLIQSKNTFIQMMKVLEQTETAMKKNI